MASREGVLAGPQGARQGRGSGGIAQTSGGELYLTPSEAASVLGVSERQLKVWRRKGDGPPFYSLSYKVKRYLRSDIMRWCEGRKFRSSHAERHGAIRTPD